MDDRENRMKNNTRDMYGGIQCERKGKSSSIHLIRAENSDLAADNDKKSAVFQKYFANFLKTLPQETEEESVEIHTAEPLSREPTNQEVAAAMNKFENNKATGNGQISAEPKRMYILIIDI